MAGRKGIEKAENVGGKVQSVDRKNRRKQQRKMKCTVNELKNQLRKVENGREIQRIVVATGGRFAR